MMMDMYEVPPDVNVGYFQPFPILFGTLHSVWLCEFLP